MNPETPPSPREELEIRLTALLMGELSPEETAALQTQLAADPELAALHARLRQAMELLREASALPEHPAPPEPVQLSAKKREHLLAHFKASGSVASSVIVKPRRDWKPYVPLGIAAALVAFLGLSLSAPMFSNRLGAPQVMVEGGEDFVTGEIHPAEGEQAKSRWDSQPGAIRPAQRGYSSRGASGADANGNHWAFRQPPAADAPTNERTTFSREDASTKLNLKTESEGTRGETPARPTILAAAPPAEPAPAMDSLGAEKTVAAIFAESESEQVALPEAMRRSVQFAQPTPAPTTASAAKPAATATPAPVALGTMPVTDPTASTSLFALVPDGGALSPDGEADRFGRAGGRFDVSARVPILPADIEGIAPAPAGPGEFDRGLSKHMDGAFGEKADMGNIAIASAITPGSNAPEAQYFSKRAVELPALAGAKAAPTPEDAKKVYFFDANVDDLSDLQEPKLTPMSDPASAAPATVETLSKLDFVASGFIGGASAQEAKEGKSPGTERTTVGRDVFFKETTRTPAPDAPAPVTASTADGTTKALGLSRGSLAQVEKGKSANENRLSFQMLSDDERILAENGRFVKPAGGEGREMKKRVDDFDTLSVTSGGVAAGQKPEENPLAWFGNGDASAANPTAARPESSARRRAKIKGQNLELALAEKPATPTDASGIESPGRRSLAVGASEPQKRDDERNPNLGKDIRTKAKAAPLAKPIIVGNKEAKQAQNTKYLYNSVDELAMLSESEVKPQVKELSDGDRVVVEDVVVRRELTRRSDYVKRGTAAIEAGKKALESKDYETAVAQFNLANDIIPNAPTSRQLSDAAAKGLSVANTKWAEERAATKLLRELETAKLESLKQQVAQKNSDDKPASPKPAEPAPEPQPEIATSANAFSTFSLNVSDVAFKLAAASLEKGQMPELATVRSEEFINAFDYRDPEPAGGAPLAFASERARYPFAQNRDLLRLSVKTAAAGRQPGRALNLVLLLDNSGSMERADRVRILHESLRVLATQLQPQDKLSVVTFARTPRLWADGVAGDKAGEVTARVGEITPQGGTNIAAALDLGYATARKHFQPGSINRVVMLTDGAANLGDVNPDALKQKVETNRQQGVALDCFGIGWEGYGDTLLEALSRNGDGRYGFINSPGEAATEFAGQLAGALRVAASDVKVQVEWNPRRVTAYRQIGYAKHQLKKEQFRDNTVDAAEIGAAESGNALYAVEVNPRGEGDLATVRVRFKVPGTSDYREHEWTVPFTREAPPLEQASPALRLAGTASAFSEWLVSSQYATEVTPDRLLSLLNGVPATFGADPRPQKLEWMIRQAKSVSGR